MGHQLRNNDARKKKNAAGETFPAVAEMERKEAATDIIRADACGEAAFPTLH